MSIVKNLVIALLVILVIAGVGIYFLPNTYTLTNSIEIDRPAHLVYGQVADFKQWNNWSAWYEAEPEAKVTFEGEAGTEGQKMHWDGEKSGAGTMNLVVAGENEALVCSNTFTRPMNATAKDYWRFEANGDKTNVVWISSGGLKYPFGRLFGLAVDKVVGDAERKGLENLKKVCEAMEMPVAQIAVTDTIDSLTVKQ